MVEQQELSPALNKRLNNLTKTFPSFNEFCEKFNPDTQEHFADERKTILNDYSTLEMIDLAYGQNKAVEWLVAQLADLNAYCGIINMRDDQTQRLAKVIYAEHKNTKFSEFMAFFLRFKGGVFGHFYGNVEPMVIASHLHDYLIENELKRRKWLNEHYEEMKARQTRQWEGFKNEMYQAVSEKEDKQYLCEVLFREYDEEHKVLTLKVPDQETYDAFDNLLAKGLHGVLVKHYGNGVRVQYRIESMIKRRTSIITDDRKDRNVQPLRNFLTGRPLLSRKDGVRLKVDYIVNTAEAIVNNTYKVSEESLNAMRSIFLQQYQCNPEQYIAMRKNNSENSEIL
jgi:hypothetical protein